MLELKIPRENANDDTVLVTSIKVQNGQFLKTDDIIFEFETSKASIEFGAPSDGYVYLTNMTEGQQIPVDTIIGELHAEIKADALQNASVFNDDTEQLEVDLKDTNVSIKAKDLLNAGRTPNLKGKWLTSQNFESNKKSSGFRSLGGNDFKRENKPKLTHEVEQISSRKSHEIDALKTSSFHLNSTLGISVELEGRRLINEFFKSSILDLLVYETTLLLKNSFSDLNAAFLDEGHIARFNEVVPGIALDEGGNLTVLALHEFTNLNDLGLKIIDGIIRFDDNKLSVQDTKSTTFTITDMSGLGVNYVLPLINGFQTFILGVCKTTDGFQLYGTFDHRVTEGKRFSQFLVELKRRIELYKLKSDIFGASGKSCHFCGKSLQEEQKQGNRGLLKIDDGKSEKLICRNCYEGW